jgi:hypothetical protein
VAVKATRLLDSILKKKWLSSNTVREGLIACFTLTLANYAKQAPLSRLGLELGENKASHPDESVIYSKVLQTALDSFRAMKIDDEYPTKDQLLKLKTIMEERLQLAKLKEDDPTLLDEHHRLAQTLLDKME